MGYAVWPDGSEALQDVWRERQRQIIDEGYSARHDDLHPPGDLGMAGSAYAWIACASDADRATYVAQAVPLEGWQWPDHCWKPTDRRRDLVKAAALILAEIDRLDRAEARGK